MSGVCHMQLVRGRAMLYIQELRDRCFVQAKVSDRRLRNLSVEIYQNGTPMITMLIFVSAYGDCGPLLHKLYFEFELDGVYTLITPQVSASSVFIAIVKNAREKEHSGSQDCSEKRKLSLPNALCRTNRSLGRACWLFACHRDSSNSNTRYQNCY